jgi:transcriptional adapter 3
MVRRVDNVLYSVHGVLNPTNILCVAAATSSSISSPASQPPPSLPDTSIQKEEPESPDSDMNPHQPPPAMPVQQFQLFGDDPSEFPDPTIYHIKEITPDMSEDEKKRIYCVAGYPDSDLHDMTPGTPPDQDFSNAKPSNQVNASTFANYVEPFIRPLTEEDRGFLTERVSSYSSTVVNASHDLRGSIKHVFHR